MKKTIIENTKIIAIATILSVAVGVASAWTAPTQVAPNGNIAAPINASSSTQIKEGGLWVGSLGVDNGLVVENGNVGIGTTTPERKLEVNGDMRVNGSIEYKNRLGKPIIRSSTISINNASSQQNQSVLVITPTSGNRLTINNLDFESQWGGRYTITYADGNVITNNVGSNNSNGIHVQFPSFGGGYQGSITRVEFFMNSGSCGSGYSSCSMQGNVVFSGYETPIGYYEEQKPIIRSSTISINNASSQQNQSFLVITPTLGSRLTINSLDFESQWGGRYTITYADGNVITNNVGSNNSNGIHVNFPDSNYTGSITRVEFFMNSGSCGSGYSSCSMQGNVVFSGFETKP